MAIALVANTSMLWENWLVKSDLTSVNMFLMKL